MQSSTLGYGPELNTGLLTEQLDNTSIIAAPTQGARGVVVILLQGT
jgi:hypothetical protein